MVWLLTLECVGVLEVAAVSEVAAELVVELTGRLVLATDVDATAGPAGAWGEVEFVREVRTATAAR